jgi:hypothetical protein
MLVVTLLMQGTAPARFLRIVQFIGHTLKAYRAFLVMKRYTRSRANLLRGSPGGRLSETPAVHLVI